MLRNYFTIAWRNIFKHKIFSLINILGLAIGMAICILAFLYISDEESYDLQNKDADRIYRIVNDFVNEDGSKTPDATTPPALAFAIQKEIPEVEHVTRLFPRGWGNNFYVRYGGKKFIEENLYHADSSVFDVFTMPFVQGNPKTALNGPNSIVLSASMAKKYFGNDNPIGKTLEIDTWPPKMVTGVMQDIPENAHFKIDMIASLKSLDEGNRLEQTWGWFSFYTYMKLKPGSDINLVDKKIRALIKEKQPQNLNYFYSQALTSIHLNSHLRSELRPNSSRLFIYVFGMVALFTLAIACINYVNLATAYSMLRVKEIAVRKISGANKLSLVSQFLCESIMFSLLAIIGALFITQMFLPLLNNIADKSLVLTSKGNYLALPALIGFAFFIGALSGVYPAMYISSFTPLKVLKGGKPDGRNGLLLRKALIVTQFIISISFIIGTIIVWQQASFMQHTNLGLDKDHVVVINDINYLRPEEREFFKNELLSIPTVRKVAASDALLGAQTWTRILRYKNSQNNHQINFLTVDKDFIDALGIKLVNGRNFDNALISDGNEDVVLNETAVKELNLPKPIIGSQIVWRENKETGELFYARVIGVVKDFHFTSLKAEIQPFAFATNKKREWMFNVKIDGSNISSTLSEIKKVWDRNIKSRPFQYTFLDETFAKLYYAEMHFRSIFFCMTIIAIFIACLGLFGFSFFTTASRIKEIGIRKVLGASVGSITAMLSKDFIKLVMIAIVIASPIAWWAMSKWLQGFAYRIDIGWWVFVAAGLLAILIALLTVSFQAIKAAVANPVKSLRTE